MALLSLMARRSLELGIFPIIVSRIAPAKSWRSYALLPVLWSSLMFALGANAQTTASTSSTNCSPTEPRIDNSGTFIAINDLKRLEARGGRTGTTGWEWALGANTQTTGKYSSANLDWVSGRVLDWTLTYDGKGGAAVVVKNGTSQVASLAYSSSTDGMTTGNALKFTVTSTADAGTAKINATVNSINSKGVTGTLATAGNSTASTSSLVYYFPALKTSSVSKGTIKFTFTGTSPPQDARLDFTITAGNVTCNTGTTDTTKPTISGTTPATNAVVGTKPAISAKYADTGTGIDTTKVSLLVDAVNVTAQSTVTATGINYTPGTALATGAHNVQLSVADKAGNVQAVSWSFSVDASAPTITGQQPVSGSATNNAKPAVNAQYTDQAGGLGIDLTKTVLLVDSVNVTPQALVSATSVSYTPTTALSSGAHTATLTVADLAGNTTQSSWSFTVDTVLPVISGLAPINKTIAAMPIASITAQYADVGVGIDTTKINLLVDGLDVTASAQVTPTGISYIPSAALSNGTHAIQLSVADKVGNTQSAAWSFSIDAQGPTVAGQLPVNGSFSNKLTPTISAQYADAGAGIDSTKTALTLDGIAVTTGLTVTATGFSYVPSAALAAGPHSVTLKVFDLVGNSTTSNWSFTIDTTGPVISAMLPSTGYGNNAKPTVSAQFSDVGAGVDASKTSLSLDGVTVTSSLLTASGVNYTPVNNLADGTHVVALSVTDLAGNSSQQSWSFTVDTSLPIISAQLPLNTTVTATPATQITAQYSDSGSGIALNTVKLLLDNLDVTASAQLNTSGLSYMPSALSSGAHSVQLSVSDMAGNAATSSWNFNIDADKPIISNQSPKDVFLQSSLNAVISASFSDVGSGIDLSRVSIFLDAVDITAQSVIDASSVRYQVTTSLSQGPHTMRLLVSDKAGNQTESTWSFAVDSQAPAIVNFSPADASSVASSASLAIKADFTDVGSGIDTAKTTLTLDGLVVNLGAASTATGINYLPAVPLSPGLHTVSISIRDLAGNSSTQQVKFTVLDAFAILDTTPQDVLTTNTKPPVLITWTDSASGIDPQAIELRIDSLLVTQGLSISGTSATYIPPLALNAGVHTASIKITDRQGNIASRDWKFEVFAIDTAVSTNSGAKPIARPVVVDLVQ